MPLEHVPLHRVLWPILNFLYLKILPYRPILNQFLLRLVSNILNQPFIFNAISRTHDHIHCSSCLCLKCYNDYEDCGRLLRDWDHSFASILNILSYIYPWTSSFEHANTFGALFSCWRPCKLPVTFEEHSHRALAELVYCTARTARKPCRQTPESFTRFARLSSIYVSVERIVRWSLNELKLEVMVWEGYVQLLKEWFNTLAGTVCFDWLS